MSTTDYESMTVREMADLARERGIKLPPNPRKAQLVEMLREHDEQAVDPADFGDLPAVAEAPDEHAPPPPPPPPKVQPQHKIPPDPPDPALLPPEPRRFRLTNDLRYPRGGMLVQLRAGAVLLETEFDLEHIKRCGGVLVDEAVFERARKARG